MLSTILLLVFAAQPQPQLGRVQPEVHSVTVGEKNIEIRSAGISIHYFGPLQSPSAPVERVQQFRFLIPRNPEPAIEAHTSVRPDITGVFVNGVPIYNPFEARSYREQNLWHFDSIAGSQDAPPGLLNDMIHDGSRHSPIIGFAFDGFPIYGPWGHTKADGSGGLKRMSSSYRLRAIRKRTRWPDGTTLTATQHGPDVGAEFPLGTFTEDYEYVRGSGDLDEYNGRFTRTPEYPNGTYAYFLSTDDAGRLAFPYLIAGRYYGKIAADDLDAAVREGPLEDAQPDSKKLTFQFQARHLEYVHERPVHVVVVSEDLSEFAHIHPGLAAGDRYTISHRFTEAGHYRIFADVTPPGGTARIEASDIYIGGKPRERVPLIPDEVLQKSVGAVRVSLGTGELRAGDDVHMMLSISSPELEPYLGAWAHIMIVDEKAEALIHAHAMGPDASMSMTHDHTQALAIGPAPPSSIHAMTKFPKPGLYKMWIQFQVSGEVLTVPFVVRVN